MGMLTGDFPVVDPPDDDGGEAVEPRACHAIGCVTELPANMDLFVCRQHYYRLSWALRGAIRDSYHPVTDVDWVPTMVYVDAAEAAIYLLAGKDGITVAGNEPQLVELARMRWELQKADAGTNTGVDKETDNADRT